MLVAVKPNEATLEDALRSALGGALRRPARGQRQQAAAHCLVCGAPVRRERASWGDDVSDCTRCGSTLEEPAAAYLSLV